MKNKIFIISGPSGVGKKTIIDSFINDDALNLSYSISMTTRQPRLGEQNAKDYYFVSHDDFQKAIENDEMVEWAEFCSNKYGTKKSEIKRIIDSNKSVLLEIEIQGALKVFKKFNRDEYVSIFIAPPSIKELKKRLKNRSTENKKICKQRIKTAKLELPIQKEYDYVVINDNLQECINQIVKIIKEAQSE
ncbi:MAG: guanylate kinase [Ureaplasma sp.]|nr:guanylate kinase [Ureaplasma sp.]